MLLGGASYELQSDLTMNIQGSDILISAGKLDLNGNQLTTPREGELIVSGTGIFEVDASAKLIFGQDASMTNDGGTIAFVGNSSDPAVISTNMASINDYYNITQNSGVFQAKYYRLEKIRDAIDFQGGSIDRNYNFSYGSFTGGSTSASHYIDFGTLDFSSWIVADPDPDTVWNVTFTDGPSQNVDGTNISGGYIIFGDASGSLSGAAFEDDIAHPGGNCHWDYPGGVFLGWR